MNKWIKKTRYIYLMKYYSTLIKEKNYVIRRQMDGIEDIMLSKDKYQMLTLICKN
jgi:hypothetical protein